MFYGIFFLVNEYIISERPFTFDLNHVLNSYHTIIVYTKMLSMTEIE